MRRWLRLDYPYFNPHEREARDREVLIPIPLHAILIHTSVKLVTRSSMRGILSVGILIHTSVKLVTSARSQTT